MKRNAWWMGAVLGAAGLLTGCVERKFIVESDPPGALVLRNNQPIGSAPADTYFIDYGNNHFTLIHDGYETLQVDQPVPTPWYQYPPLDFISENLIPWTISDVRRFHYQMQPLQVPSSAEVLDRATELRGRGQLIGPPPAPPTAPPAPPNP
jgi:hypothetical protein